MTLKSLKEERDALREDAERYRYLRQVDIKAIKKGGVFAGMTPENVVINKEHLDIAVDNARKLIGADNA